MSEPLRRIFNREATPRLAEDADSRAFYDSIQQRLRSLTPDHFSTISELTGVHAESVRRYMSVAETRVPLHFVIAIARAYHCNLLWLLTGEGPKEADQLPEWMVRQLPSPKLFSLIGDRLAALDTILDQRRGGDEPQPHHHQ